MTVANASIETRIYLRVVSSVLTLDEVSSLLGLRPTRGWSIGAPTRRGVPQDHTNFMLDSGCSRDSPAADHLNELLEFAEQMACVVGASPGLLDLCCLEVVQEFEGSLSCSLVLNKRWIDALVGLRASVDIDQYIDIEPTDVERPSVPDGFMIGQRLSIALLPLSGSSRIDLDGPSWMSGELQEKWLQQVLGRIPDSNGEYRLHIEQSMSRIPWTETGLGISADTLIAASSRVSEIHICTTVSDDPPPT